MSLANSDIIPYYDSTIRLGQGDYDYAIREVPGLANLLPSPSNPTSMTSITSIRTGRARPRNSRRKIMSTPAAT